MGDVKLLLARHGETIENIANVLQGHLPGKLSKLGLRQAELLADKLDNIHLDNVVCSDLKRSYDTAKVIADRHSLIPIPTPLLKEMDWGVYTGQNMINVDWENLPSDVESTSALLNRAKLFLNYIRINFRNQTVVAVGHGAFNRAIEIAFRGEESSEMINLPIMKNATYNKYILKNKIIL